jgi:uncharacterized RDD family membrane protein YckC
LAVETPENVVFGYDVAGIGSRFLAALVDSLIIVAALVVVNLAGALIANYFIRPLFDDDDAVTAWLIGAAGLLAFAVLWGYYMFFELVWNGQSPGKRLAGLRVIRADGTPITLTESIIRNLVRLVDFLPGYYGLGVVVMFIDGRSRRLGDLAAGTLVVRDRGPVTLASVVERSAPPPPTYVPTSYTTQWPLERLTAADQALAQDFVRRRGQLTNRAALALRLAQTIAQHLELPAAAVPAAAAEEVVVELANYRPPSPPPQA